MTPNLEPLDDDVLALLREAKSIPDLDAETTTAIFAAVEARIGLPPTPSGGGSPGGSSGTPAAGPAGAGGVKALAVLAATFAIGVGTGIALAPSVRTMQSALPASAVARTVALPASAALLPASESPLLELPDTRPPPPPATMASGPTRNEPVEPLALSARGLAAERRLLDVARAALARGDASVALVAVERHGREYPGGTLVEEREALAVKALVALGRRDEARERAERFEKRFPNGLLLRAVKGAVGELG